MSTSDLQGCCREWFFGLRQKIPRAIMEANTMASFYIFKREIDRV
jgi:hypothetical protein